MSALNRCLVSLVSDAHATATSDPKVSDVLADIKSGKWREPVERIPAEYTRAMNAQPISPRRVATVSNQPKQNGRQRRRPKNQ